MGIVRSAGRAISERLPGFVGPRTPLNIKAGLEDLGNKAGERTRSLWDSAKTADWKSIANSNAFKGVGFGAGVGAIGGGIAGGFSDDGSIMGGTFKGSLLGAGVAPGLKYGGMGISKLGAMGRTQAVNMMGGKDSIRALRGMKLDSWSDKVSNWGAKTTGVGNDLYGAAKSSYGAARGAATKAWNASPGWSAIKSGAWNQTWRAGTNMVGGAAAGGAGWLTADIMNKGAGWDSFSSDSFMGAVGSGAMLGLGYRGAKIGANAINKVAHTKYAVKAPIIPKIGDKVKTVANHPLTYGAVGLAAAAQGFQKTQPVNAHKRA